MAPRRRHELRPAQPDDAVQDKGESRRVRLGRPLHLPGPDGRRHPPLPDRPRPDRRRPAPAPRAHPRPRGALQPRFGATFTVPARNIPETGAPIMDQQEPPKKMSTTGGTPQGTLLLLDPPDVIRKKFKTAVTDSGREVRRARDKPGVSNLLDILSAVATGPSAEAIEPATTAPATAGSRRMSPRPWSRSSRSRRATRAAWRPSRAHPPAARRCRQGPRRCRTTLTTDVRPHGLRPAGVSRWRRPRLIQDRPAPCRLVTDGFARPS